MKKFLSVLFAFVLVFSCFSVFASADIHTLPLPEGFTNDDVFCCYTRSDNNNTYLVLCDITHCMSSSDDSNHNFVIWSSSSISVYRYLFSNDEWVFFDVSSTSQGISPNSPSGYSYYKQYGAVGEFLYVGVDMYLISQWVVIQHPKNTDVFYTVGGSSVDDTPVYEYDGLSASEHQSLFQSVINAISNFSTNLQQYLHNEIESSLDSIQAAIELIKNDISQILSSTRSFFQEYFSVFSTFKTELFDKLDYYFNPNSEQIVEDTGTSFSQSVSSQFESKFTFLETFRSSFADIGSMSGALDIHSDIQIGSFVFPLHIDVNFFEPYKGQIRGGIAVIFNILTALACFRLISGIFHTGIGKAVGGIYQGSDPASTTISDISTVNHSDGSRTVTTVSHHYRGG